MGSDHARPASWAFVLALLLGGIALVIEHARAAPLPASGWVDLALVTTALGPIAWSASRGSEAARASAWLFALAGAAAALVGALDVIHDYGDAPGANGAAEVLEHGRLWLVTAGVALAAFPIARGARGRAVAAVATLAAAIAPLVDSGRLGDETLALVGELGWRLTLAGLIVSAERARRAEAADDDARLLLEALRSAEIFRACEALRVCALVTTFVGVGAAVMPDGRGATAQLSPEFRCLMALAVLVVLSVEAWALARWRAATASRGPTLATTAQIANVLALAATLGALVVGGHLASIQDEAPPDVMLAVSFEAGALVRLSTFGATLGVALFAGSVWQLARTSAVRTRAVVTAVASLASTVIWMVWVADTDSETTKLARFIPAGIGALAALIAFVPLALLVKELEGDARGALGHATPNG